MNQKRAIQWLYEELPVLEQAAVISPETILRIREHYGPVTIQSRRQLALLLLSVLGALLIGLGVILLLAHNWDTLPRTGRIILSFSPLLIGQILVGWTLLKRHNSLAWKEGSGLFLALSVGASIALISQTYHISGSMSTFLLTWIILGGPILYILNASSVALLYIVGITCWAGAVQSQGGQAVLFWFLASFLVPHVWQAYDRNAPGPRMHLLSWAICLALPIALGLVLERRMPGLWVLIYSGTFSSLFIFGRLIFKDSKLNAFTISGFIGIVILGIVFTYTSSWRHIGWWYYRSAAEYDTLGVLQDYLLVLLALTSTAVPLVRSVSSRDRLTIAAVGLPLLAIFAFSASSLGLDNSIIAAVFNLYLLCFGGIVMWYGFARERLLYINVGMIVLALLIIVRFFDAHISFTIRGILFILLGFAFLGVNLYLSRKMKETSS
ncbi:MAG: DUF2157 domain-containing protein [Candidatus Hydrogenedentes bacterium]|nr:DUF2157 domain-containing protein [Candidatus Hydrogenedentota bacterium]